MSKFISRTPKLDKLEAAKILENIFAECEEEPNSVPMEELSSYSNYRKESFRLQRGILIGAMVIFLVLPIMFVAPKFETTFEARGERGLPVYTVDISTMLPVKKVVAVIKDRRLPVYAVSRHKYTIEPTSNGTIELCVELFNGQWTKTTLEVQAIDDQAPQIFGIEKKENGCQLQAEDLGVGIDFEGIYGENVNGDKLYPSDYDSREGKIIFSENMEGFEIVIPDHYGNILRVKL